MITEEVKKKWAKYDETTNRVHKLLDGLAEHLEATRCEHCRDLFAKILGVTPTEAGKMKNESRT